MEDRYLQTDRVKECYNCTIKTTKSSNNKRGNKDTVRTERLYSFPRKRSYRSYERSNERKLHTDSVQEQRRRYDDRDVATNTGATAGILIQPVTQSAKDCNTAEKELFVVLFGTQKSTKSARIEVIPVQQE